MRDKQQNSKDNEPQRIKLTAHLTLNAYDAIAEIQRRHRRSTGRVLPIWKILDTAITAYAKLQGIRIGEE